mgnify:CR=1 FL=1
MEYIAAGSPGDVLAALADGDTAVLAGGQSLVLDVANREFRPGRVVDINRVPEFEILAEAGGMLRVGPLVRHRTFETYAAGGALGALLRTIVQHIGHPPIRARGTMTGSLAYAHPAAEWPVVATVLGAEIDLQSRRGRRTVTGEQFFTGPFTTVRRPDELLAEVRLPLLPAGTGAGFAEHRPARAKYAETAAMAAVTLTGGVVTAAAVGLVNAATCPVRARAAEKALLGSRFDDAAIRAAAEAAADLDANLSALPPGERPAKRKSVGVLTRRALTRAREGM